ncbi:MAG: AAA family ATPase [Candidatus Woesearchaeota archaeon]
MRIESISLHNIRSYLSESVTFPQGSVLLAGDIGSGKSTILLAVEFALFGIMPGTLSGNALLRNGKNEGSVELSFTVDNSHFVVKRNLKRVQDKVLQQAGFIMRDGVKKDATASELKAEVLEILGYPKELLTKSKNLIYRFTVYTPQEEMRQILAEDKEARLETLRKLFGIDKYKRIRENATVLSRSIKEQARILEGKIFDLQDKQSRKSELNSQIELSAKKFVEASERLVQSKLLLQKYKAVVISLEERVKKAVELRKTVEILDSKLSLKSSELERTSRELRLLDSQVRVLAAEIQDSASVIDPKERPLMETQHKALEEQLRSRLTSIATINAKLQNSGKLQDSVLKLSVCPVCLQTVSDSHKHEIQKREAELISSLKSDLDQERAKESVERAQFSTLKQRLDEITSLMHQQELSLVKRRNLDENKSRLSKRSLLTSSLSDEIIVINQEKLSKLQALSAYEAIDKEYAEARKTLESSELDERKSALDLARLEKESESLREQLAVLDREISVRLQFKSALERLRTLRNWIEEFFINLMLTMEKHVFARVFQEFDANFQQWFRLLLEDDLLAVRLDDEFAPVVEQNGYELELENLSGGEKTSVALAYRLALNKVVNDVISTIKTKNLIILDEPTDGFSTEQLDRVRDVIEQLHIPQVIIVSHEQKMEAFVETVIKLEKHEHSTRISQ